MLRFCANRIMSLQELQATGTMAVGFRETGCYNCTGRDDACRYFTPIAWIYESEESVPPGVKAFVRKAEG